jgi:drug/metabolite transporter (DMT)-like permease
MVLSQSKKGVIALIALAWVFATMGVFARFLSTEFDLFEQTYLRIGLAFLIGAVIFSSQCNWRLFKNLPGRDLAIIIFRTACLYLGVVMITEAFLHTKYSNATFAASLPLLPVFGYFLLKEKIKVRTVGYILLGFVGLVIMTVEDSTQLSVGYGELMALGSLILFDLSYVTRKWQSEHLNNYETTVAMFLIGTVLLFATSVSIGEGLPTVEQFTPVTLGILFIAALFNVANLILTNYGFQNVKAAVAGNIISLESVFALGYGIVLFGEVMTGRELIGSAVILFSVFMVNRSEQ